MSSAPGGSKRIDALDGLRGIAVSMVALSHIHNLPFWRILAPIADGPAGVRVFLVISGFIITTLIAAEWSATGSINIRRFYARRLTKLGPPLGAYMLAVGILHLVAGGRCGALDFGLALSFLTDLNAGRSCWLLGQTWSLSVEEVFYLSWAALWLLVRRRFVWIGVAAATGLALYHRVHYGFPNIPRDGPLFVWPPYRLPFVGPADCLAAGCAAALLLQAEPGSTIGRIVAKLKKASSSWSLLALLGFFLLVSAQAYGVAYAGWATGTLTPTLEPLCIAFVALQAGTGAKGLGDRLLSVAPLRGLGRISYSFYLWQQFFDALNPDRDGVYAFQNHAWSLPAALAVAYLSFRLFEVHACGVLRRRLKVGDVTASELTLSKGQNQGRAIGMGLEPTASLGLSMNG